MNAAVVALCLCAAAALVAGYPSGAPTTICGTLTPTHSKGAILPKNSPSPFAINAQVPRVAQGNSLKLLVSSPQGMPFQGFMVQARNPAEPRADALGAFTVVPVDAQAINCFEGIENTVTHRNKSIKTSLEFEWQPPADYVGSVVFHGTVLQDYSTFWSGVRSDHVEVVKRSLDNSGQSAGISTTRRPKTTTPTPTLRPQAEVGTQAVSDPLTEGCGTIKSCFGVPEGCIAAGDCDAVVACYVKPDVAEFEMRAKGSKYVAVGLSDDGKMGTDSVVECVQPDTGSRPPLFMSWNEGRTNKRMPGSAEDNGLSLIDGSFVDGQISCKFQRAVTTTINGVEFNLIRDPHFLLLAAGTSLKADGVGFHDVLFEKTSEAHFLTSGDTFKSASKLLLRLHGAFMISAWIGAASVGILLARYFKQTWVGNQLCGKDQWFAWHRFFMVLTWLLTIAGFVVIFVELQDWSKENNPHAILGTITTGLAFIQPFMAALRPAPTSSRRPLFNWAHWLVGNAAHILAIVTIFFASKLSKAELPSWLDWVLVSYVAFHVVMHLILSIAGCASEKNSSKRVNTFPMKDMNSSSRAAMQAERSLDAPHAGLRKFLLALYLLVIILLTAGIVVIVVLAPIGDTIKEIQKIIMPGSV